MVAALSVAILIGCTGAADVVRWTFDTEADAKAWVANGHLKNVVVKDGVVRADAVDRDPFFTCKGIEFQATPWQYVLLRMKASRPGQGQLFWSGETTGQYDSFSPQKVTSFQVRGTGQWEQIAVFPFWQTEGTIRQLRLDVYEGAHFEVDAIRVLSWGDAKPPITDVYSWPFKGDTSAWQASPGGDILLAPRLRLSVGDRPWVMVVARSDKAASVGIIWSASDVRGMQQQTFVLRGDGKLRHYNVELSGVGSWRDPIVAFGLRLPTDVNLHLESVQIAEEPSGPPELDVAYLGLENGAIRAGRPAGVIAQFRNNGGSAARGVKLKLTLPDGLICPNGKTEQILDELDYDDQKTLAWPVVAERPGDYTIRLLTKGAGASELAVATLRFLPALNLPKADYVPEPRSVETDLDVCAYYYPGWYSSARWDCIRRVAPIRKPILGYYDEANPECVDWQIKWAIENGITCFLVDWYWAKGSKRLEHWFDAYRKARYRDRLKVAIMWANHIPPGSHSPEDWHKVTREWIERYFTLKSYYHIDGKPAVFLWSPHNIRRDLGGPEAVAKLFAESQAMAKTAGHRGISFLAMFGHESNAGVEALLKEGYYGATNYHEWADATSIQPDRKRVQYQDIVTTVRKTWEAKVARCGKLVYYPVVETGWDSRPWHGDRSQIINGRTPARFEDILRQAKSYCKQIGRHMVVLGPINEWGEGSYIEPNTEFGFEMYEAIRRVFARGDSSSWPMNVAPADVGRGPYDFPKVSSTTDWTFDADAGGWSPMMGVGEFAVKNGTLRFKTTTHDPAIMTDTGGIRARKLTQATIRMQLVGDITAGDRGQMFFSIPAQSMTDATSFYFPLATDGKMHTYTVDLTKVPRWRRLITTLRFDPCSAKDVEVIIDEIKLK